MNTSQPEQGGCGPECGCTPNRRTLLKVAAVGAASLALRPVMAGPFDAADWASVIPVDKKLRPEWLASLTARGTPTQYTKSRNELRFIGMPVGGLCCGTMYLAGDGRLWLWDIFNQNKEGILQVPVKWSEVGMSFGGSEKDPNRTIGNRSGARYVRPATPEESPKIAQGFAVKITAGGKTIEKPLDATGWEEVTFTGQYPVATIEYRDAASPVRVTLDAYSPFIPLNFDDSCLPVTLFDFVVSSEQPAEVEISGFLQNACSLYSGAPGTGKRISEVVRGEGVTLVQHRFEVAAPTAPPRPNIVVEDFEKGYENWNVQGEAFGKAPAKKSEIPDYQGDVGGEGQRVVNSHATAPGEGVGPKDAKVGKLTSKPFKIERKYLSFYIGGGADPAKVGLRLLIDGKEVHGAAGRNNNAMRREAFNVSQWEGKEAVIEIYDNGTGGWGNIGVDHIVLTDTPQRELPLAKRGDFGTMAIALLGEASRADAGEGADPIARLTKTVKLEPGRPQRITFAICWHFPNNPLRVSDATLGNYYAKRFADARAVAMYIAKEYPRLSAHTKLFRDTWADSTLPHWFLERTLVNISILATTTCHRFANGRFWAWEGIGCCEGTCTHVWQYAQALGRLFPEVERDHRARIDFGAGFEPGKGFVRHRGENTGPAIDGHCGRILGVYREHQMSASADFLKGIWPNVKKAAQHVLDHDVDADGILDGAQENTLDAAWFGQIAWISSLAMASLRAAEEMAREMGDSEFAAACRARFEKGKASLELKLFNGEYFIHLPEKGKEKNLGTYQGCHIDQVFGQSWAWQVGLGRTLDRDKTLSALKALWKYNFTPDVGPFRAKNKDGRPYALAGDGGLIMSSNPKNLPDPYGAKGWQSGYFNECMSGFEHQVASHMIAEGMLTEGLAITRAIHDRYHAARRNPFNEVECSDHYSRAMASYGSFIAACGFTCHGPAGRIGFAPRISPENFRAPFTAAECWGTLSQRIAGGVQQAGIAVRWGRLRLKAIALEAAGGKVEVTLGGKKIDAAIARNGGRVEVQLKEEVVIEAEQELTLKLT